MPLGDPAQWLNLGGAVATLGFFITSFLRGWIVTGAQYAEMRRDRDDWKQLALTGTKTAANAVDIAQQSRRIRELAREGA